MTIKKITHSEAENLWFQITGSSFDQTKVYSFDGKPVNLGLLKEAITQGAKTKLKKVLKVLEPHLETWKETLESLQDNESPIDEPFEIQFELCNIEASKIDEIISIVDYDFTKDLIFE